ncbi:hypothetical protein ABFU82_22010 [Nocardioides sp. WV_118_6]
MRAVRSLAVGLVLLATTGCSGGVRSAPAELPEPAPPHGPAALPDNLCTTLPAGLVARWRLTETEHETVPQVAKETAACTLAGRHRGRPLTLRVELNTQSGTDPRDTYASVRLLREAWCSAQGNGHPWGSTFDETITGCTMSYVAHRLVRIEIAGPLAGVARIEVSSGVARYDGIAAEVEALTQWLTALPPGPAPRTA